MSGCKNECMLGWRFLKEFGVCVCVRDVHTLAYVGTITFTILEGIAYQDFYFEMIVARSSKKVTQRQILHL